jgi:hypothetical protein
MNYYAIPGELTRPYSLDPGFINCTYYTLFINSLCKRAKKAHGKINSFDMIDMREMGIVITSDVIIIVIAVALRFWCKHKMKAGYHGDDWWTLMTAVSFIGCEIALLWGTNDCYYLLVAGLIRS